MRANDMQTANSGGGDALGRVGCGFCILLAIASIVYGTWQQPGVRKAINQVMRGNAAQNEVASVVGRWVGNSKVGPMTMSVAYGGGYILEHSAGSLSLFGEWSIDQSTKITFYASGAPVLYGKLSQDGQSLRTWNPINSLYNAVWHRM
jgi:hypothetical protein